MGADLSRSPFVARRTELARIQSALDDAAAGSGRVVVVQGVRGVGKTALLHETARAAGAKGFTVVYGRARRSDRGMQVPLLVVAALRCASSVSDGYEVDELIDGLVSLAPVAVVLDDAQFADEISIRVLEEMAHRIRRDSVLLVAAMSTRPSNGHGRHLAGALQAIDYATTLRLHMLGDDDAADLIRAVIPEAGPEFCAECVEVTGGSPFLLSELTAWIGANRIEPVQGAANCALEPVPPVTIREFVRRQVEELGPDAAALATAMAILDRRLSLEKAAPLAGLDRPRSLRAVDALLESGLIVPGELLSFGAPLVAHCLRTSTPAALASDLHSRAATMALAGDLPDESTTRHLLLAPPAGNPEVVDRLVELADGEVADGRPGEARALIRRALAEDGPGHPAKPHLVARLGLVDLLEGRPASTPALAAAVAALDSARDRADALVKLGSSQFAADAPREAWFSFDAARALVGHDDPLGAEAEIASLIAKLFVPEARSAAVPELERMGQVPNVESAAHGADVLLTLAWRRLCQGAPSRDIARLATRALAARSAGRPSINGFFPAATAILLATIDDFARAHEVCDAYVAAAREQGSVLAERHIKLARAVVLLHQGHLVRAGELARSLMSRRDAPQFFATEAAAILASVLHEQGSYHEADQIVARATLTSPAEAPRRLLLLEVSARVSLEHGRLGEALREIAEAESLAKALEISNPAVVGWQPTAALCYRAVGQWRRAQTLAEDALEVAESFGRPRLLALALRTKAEIEGPPTELEYLRRALEAIDGDENQLERAKVLVSHGAALHRAGRDHAARGLLREGIGLADRVAATNISRRGLSMLRAAGGRPRRAQMTGPEALTHAERQVVDLAAGGATNREIAETLVVTRKTIEWHLQKAFAKLGIRSRTELAGVMEISPAAAFPTAGNRTPVHS
jgi:DNA-binding CsgD family transcriptional regulator